MSVIGNDCGVGNFAISRVAALSQLLGVDTKCRMASELKAKRPVARSRTNKLTSISVHSGLDAAYIGWGGYVGDIFDAASKVDCETQPSTDRCEMCCELYEFDAEPFPIHPDYLAVSVFLTAI